MMRVSCQRKIVPILSIQVSRWQAIGNYDCNCCNFSVATPDPRSREDTSVNDEDFGPNSKDNPLDTFTEKLVTQKLKKWKNLYSKTRPSISGENSLQLPCYQKSNLSDGFKDEKSSLVKAMDSDEIIQFLHEFQKIKILAGHNVLDFYRKQDSTEEIKSENVNENSSYEEYKKQINDINLAQVSWKNGHFVDALNLFWDVYTQNNKLHVKIKYVLLTFMANTISRKGEAVLLLIINFSKKVVEVHADYTFLSYVWECCFLSEWHSDNEIAASLLEEYPELKNTIQRRVHHITNSSLLSHKVEVTQRLFEVLLKYEMKTEYELVLRTLFDYACFMMDFYACSAIVQSCHDLDVTLTDDQNLRFIKLFSQQSDPQIMKQKMKIWPTEPLKFKLKF